MLTDSTRRALRYLRVSLTDRCNLRCLYCMPEEGTPSLPHEQILRFEEIEAVLRVAVQMGLTSVRLTGGEPLARRGVVQLVERLHDIPGLTDLSLTTNGTLLAEAAASLRRAGLQRLNIGLPSLDRATYARLVRRDALPQALAGLEAALAEGYHPLKVNVVVLRGINDELAPFVALTAAKPVEVRFIEYMPIGPLSSQSFFLPAVEIERRLRAEGPLQEAEPPLGMGPATRYWRLPGAPGRLAVLAPMSEHLCPLCNRLRLTADGRLLPCLFSDHEIDLKPSLRPSPSKKLLEEAFYQAAAEKPRCMEPQLPQEHRHMAQIGG
ncbi:MAG: GTP 3',8-cyclase MoaA [bacterium]